MIYDHARKMGITLRKKANDHSSATHFVTLNAIPAFGREAGNVIENLTLRARIPATRWHKQGAPYLDTFSELHIIDGTMQLANTRLTGHIASCRSTGGAASQNRYLCPKCGKVHSGDSDTLCPNCEKELYEETAFGRALTGRLRQYKGAKYPSCFFHKGRPTHSFGLYLQVEKLCRC